MVRQTTIRGAAGTCQQSERDYHRADQHVQGKRISPLWQRWLPFLVTVGLWLIGCNSGLMPHIVTHPMELAAPNGDCRGPLCCCQEQPQEEPLHRDQAETMSLHTLPPMGRLLSGANIVPERVSCSGATGKMGVSTSSFRCTGYRSALTPGQSERLILLQKRSEV
jgi:hypothetical protein